MKKIICLYGPPGSGKTTQADLLAENYGFTKFGMGERLRSEISSGSKLGKKIQPYVENGSLIPDEYMLQIVREAEQMSSEAGIVFDGFPRIVSQAEMLDDLVENLNLKVNAFIHITLPSEEALIRIKERALLRESRSDDVKEQAIKSRFQVFADESQDLLEFYRDKGLLTEVDGSQKITQVQKDIISSIEL